MEKIEAEENAGEPEAAHRDGIEPRTAGMVRVGAARFYAYEPQEVEYLKYLNHTSFYDVWFRWILFYRMGLTFDFAEINK